MSDDGNTPGQDDALATLHAILAELRGLREDLKRRSKRQLEQAGAIPATAPNVAHAAPHAAAAPSQPGLDLGATLPRYGRSSGQPVRGATLADLRFYAGGCERSIADPAKARWRDKERVTLAAIEAEIARQQAMASVTPRDADGEQRGFGPPPSAADDDIPF